MPIEIEEEGGGKLVTVCVTGKLSKADYERCVPEFDRPIRPLLISAADGHDH